MSTGNKDRLEFLLHQYVAETITEEDLKELSEILQQDQDEMAIKDVLTQMSFQAATLTVYDRNEVDAMINRILNKAPAKVVRMKNGYGWMRIAAAAVIILMISTGVIYLTLRQSQDNKSIGVEKPTISKNPIIPNDVTPPNTANAVLTLSNGQKIALDSAGKGVLAMQGNVKLVKLADGRIVYSPESGAGSQEITYNTLTNPRGSKVIDITLADGSKVWLNAGSSVTYPVAFVGKERKVSIIGEAYFEVAHNAAMPFKVNKGDMEVQVLGTHFNVNAYDDEAHINVTLLEGSVNVSKGNASGLLKSGQQAQISSDPLTGSGQVKVVKGVDIEEVMAWKNGHFQFKESDIQTILRQVARWYDVDVVVYEGAIPERTFSGEVSRNANLSQLLRILEASKINFSIEGRKITVRP
ncbi:MAG: FecR domain-containing protein [Ginsengibacter sp.]